MTDTTEVTAADGSKYFVYKGIINALATVEPSAAEIAAMETLIADEYALETAFEGSRFFDLMRLQQRPQCRRRRHPSQLLARMAHFASRSRPLPLRRTHKDRRALWQIVEPRELVFARSSQQMIESPVL